MGKKNAELRHLSPLMPKKLLPAFSIAGRDKSPEYVHTGEKTI
jgi:hypothetical protein